MRIPPEPPPLHLFILVVSFILALFGDELLLLDVPSNPLLLSRFRTLPSPPLPFFLRPQRSPSPRRFAWRRRKKIINLQFRRRRRREGLAPHSNDHRHQ